MVKRLNSLITAFIAAQGVAGGADIAWAQASKTFSDWIATCDNTRACTAIGTGAPESFGGGSLVVRREAGGDAAPHVTLVAQFDWGQTKERLIEIDFDEAGFDNVFPKRLDMSKLAGDGARITLPIEAQEKFVAALRKAKKLTLRRQDIPASKDGVLEVSLSGAVAALLWIDERQRRARNATALIARGPTPASAVPAPRHAPVVTRAKTRAQALNGKPTISILTAWKKACDEWGDAGADASRGYELAPGLALWSMPCSRGAYNFSSMYFLAPRGGAVVQSRFETLKEGQPVADETELVNSEFDPRDFNLSFYSKGRGLGDCGTKGKHVWDGKAFRLVEMFTMDACKGVLSDDWPRVWKAEVK